MAQLPSQLQRAQERSVSYTLAADTAIFVVIVIVALLTGSLTLASEGLRIFIILVAGYWNLWCLMAVHRNNFSRYHFGSHKFEHLATVLCGLGLIAAGFLVAEGVISLIFAEREAASPAGLALAAIVNAINVLINILGWMAMIRSSAAATSEAFRAQLRVRVTLLISSGAVQITLTAAALAKDPLIAILLDATGATIVAVIMLSHGLKMIWRSMPVMLDASSSPDFRSALLAAVRKLLPDAVIHSIQTRRIGDGHVARVTVHTHPDLSSDVLRESAAALERALSDDGAPHLVSVVARTREGILAAQPDA